MKKNLLLFLVVALVATMLMACSTPAETETADANGEAPATETETPAAETPEKVYTIKLSYTGAEADPMVQGLYEMEKNVEARTNGGIDIQVFHSGQLANTADMIEAVKTGGNIGGLTDTSRVSATVPGLDALNAPYVFDSYEDGVKVITSPLALEMYDQVEETTGIKVLAFNYWQGSRNIFTKEPVNSMADLEGMRIRSPGTEMFNTLISSWGAKPAGLAWSEIYSALQQKVVDGAEGQLSGSYSSNMHEVADYTAVTGHIHLFTGLVVSSDWFNELPEEYQVIMEEEAVNGGTFGSQIVLDGMVEWQKDMEDNYGHTFTYPDLAPFKEAAQDVYDQMPAVAEAKEQFDAYLAE